jgi:hypothetical protein
MSAALRKTTKPVEVSDTKTVEIRAIPDDQGPKGVTVFVGLNKAGDPIHRAEIPTPIAEVIQTVDHATANGTMQKTLIEAMERNGRAFSKGQATSFLERFTPGFSGFKWCPLLVALNRDEIPKGDSMPNARRFFMFNNDVWKGVARSPAKMLTGKRSPNSGVNSLNTHAVELSTAEEVQDAEEVEEVEVSATEEVVAEEAAPTAEVKVTIDGTEVVIKGEVTTAQEVEAVVTEPEAEEPKTDDKEYIELLKKSNSKAAKNAPKKKMSPPPKKNGPSSNSASR